MRTLVLALVVLTLVTSPVAAQKHKPAVKPRTPAATKDEYPPPSWSSGAPDPKFDAKAPVPGVLTTGPARPVDSDVRTINVGYLAEHPEVAAAPLAVDFVEVSEGYTDPFDSPGIMLYIDQPAADASLGRSGEPSVYTSSANVRTTIKHHVRDGATARAYLVAEHIADEYLSYYRFRLASIEWLDAAGHVIPGSMAR